MADELRVVTNLVPLTLVGLDGNAFNLMGAFKHAARRCGTPKNEIDAVIEKCMSSDYDHLLVVLMENTTDPDENEEGDWDPDED